MAMVSREPTVVELLEGLGHATGKVAAKKHARMEGSLSEARDRIADILFAYEACFDPDATQNDTARDLQNALAAGRDHLRACGREYPRTMDGWEL